MKEKKNKFGEIIIFKGKQGTQIQVAVEKDTVWLTQEQLANLFNIERSVITKHIANVFDSGELKEKSNVQKMHIPNSDKPVKLFNLDVIISVGYRVNSARATQFRIWATNVLKNHLVQGYTVNQKRLLEKVENLKELQKTIAFIQSKSQSELLDGKQNELLSILNEFAKTFELLKEYDENSIVLQKAKKPRYDLNNDDALLIISETKEKFMASGEASEMFGVQPADKLNSITATIYQTFGGQDLYPSLEEKAANLLYFVIKDHPFIDGNKRIASLLFIYFLERNRFLTKPSGERKINDNALVSLALLVAVSNPSEKETMINLITNLIK